MNLNIFNSGDKSSFAKKSRSMAKVLALGAGSLAIVFNLFIFFYFPSNAFIKGLSLVLPIIYLVEYLLSFSKITNQQLYKIIFYVFIFTSYVLLYIAYQFSFNSEFIIIMLVIYNIILIALPTPKQVLTYFGLVFIPLEITLLFSTISLGFALLITVSFGYVFALSYVISLQKKGLNKRSHQNAEILKALVNNSKDAIFLVDYFSKEIWDANEKSKEIFGLTDINEILSKKYYSLFLDEEFINLNRNEITQQLAQIGYYQANVLFKRNDKTEFLGNFMISPFKAAKNNYYLIQINPVTQK